MAEHHPFEVVSHPGTHANSAEQAPPVTRLKSKPIPRPIEVLHVDDDPDVLALVALQVERMDDGISIRTETDPTAVPERIRDEPIDCLVSDYEMPELDGLELLRIVRDRNPDLPVILYTGKGTEEVAAAAIDAGITDYMRKEIGTKQYAVLATRIRNAVESTRRNREIDKLRARYTALAEQSLVSVISIVDGRFAFVNDRYTELIGRSATDLSGTSIDSVIGPPEAIKTLHSTTIGEAVSIPITCQHTDGSTIDAIFDGRRVPNGSTSAILGVVLPAN